MVKGLSRQVSVVNSPEPKLFEQAIFFVRDDVGEGITDELLMKEAQQAIRSKKMPRRHFYLYGAFWSSLGASLMGLVWLLTVLL